MAKRGTKILDAYWETPNRGVVHLNKDWLAVDSVPPLFLNPGKRPLRTLEKAAPLEYGKKSGYFLDMKGNITFVFWPEFYHNFEGEEEDIYVVGSFNRWGEKGQGESWKLSPQTIDGKKAYSITVPIRKVGVTKKHMFKFITGSGCWLDIPADAPNSVRDEEGAHNFQIIRSRTGHHVFYFQPQGEKRASGEEELIWEKNGKTEAHVITSGEWLNNLYSDCRLGSFLRDGQTVFRLFAPRATRIELLVSASPDMREPMVLEMSRMDEMVWEKVYPKNLEGHFYHYSVDGINRDNFSHFDKSFRITDPYAVAVMSREGPALMVDHDSLPVVEEPFQPPAWHDLIILETHVRDLLAHAPCDLTDDERLGFTGLAKWLRSDDCYLKELGVNAVELQPIQEFDNQSREEYHWGYMTCNYFSPESTYSLAPERASQIEEFSDCVSAFHEQGIAVILDVVYNHVGEPNNLLFIDKQYYFETDHDGNLDNWSGCGNDLKCSAPMVKRMIIDSLIHLVRTYDVDGFRFDLAELIGVDVLKEIEHALKAVKPSLILIAEPWSFRGHIAHALKPTGWSSWNDGYRDFILDYVLGKGNQEGIRYFMAGSLDHFARFPAQSVNYTESHDDRCWLDRLTEQPDYNGNRPTQNDRRRTHLMCAILMSSIGIPMLAEGQDMLRSKEGINNTYQRGDVNALNYGRQQDYPNTFQYFRRWVQFRLSDCGRLLRLSERPSESYLKIVQVENSSAIGILYNADYSQGSEQLFFAANPHYTPLALPFDQFDLHEFTQIADHERFQVNGLEGGLFRLHAGDVFLPGLSCGLWFKE